MRKLLEEGVTECILPTAQSKKPENNPEIVLYEDPRNNSASALYGHFLVPALIQLDEISSGYFLAWLWL